MKAIHVLMFAYVASLVLATAYLMQIDTVAALLYALVSVFILLCVVGIEYWRPLDD